MTQDECAIMCAPYRYSHIYKIINMNKTLRYTLFILCCFAITASEAQTRKPDALGSKIEGTWFASGLYSINIANNGLTYSGAGVMGGYINNWGGYLKVDFPISISRTPNISGGATKSLATFRHSYFYSPSTLHLYFGMGYGNLLHGREMREHDHIYHPDGTVECLPGTEHIVRDWDTGSCVLAEIGVIYRCRHLNFILGTGITPDILGAMVGSGDSPNISIQLGIGYTF